ncbi:MAG: prepilin-type N-terminal cleavage/methylation domain-containing protein [Gemmatimonadetes bacterium]|nr:prepilin-type N-terminal cleavage/methylation domain-containing protein [Gemmatimonadota bacterium]
MERHTANVREIERKRGFTAIEIVIVLVIVGLVASFAMPRISTTVARDRVGRAQFVVGSQIELAFQYAARTRKPVTVTLNSSTRVLTIADRASGTPFKTLNLSQSGPYALTGATISPSAGVTIFPTGISTGAVTITLSNNAYSRTVGATIAGQVTKS